MFGKKQKEIDRLAYLLRARTMDLEQAHIKKSELYHQIGEEIKEKEQLVTRTVELQRQFSDMTMQASAWHERYKEVKHFPSEDD
jgi:vacuolar-type H+-ATPase subunit I/STV1